MNLPRLLPVTAALALLLSACGSSEPADGQPLDQPDATVDSGGLRIPTPIRTAGGGSAGTTGQPGALGNDAAMSSEMAIAPWRIITEFIAGDGLGALPDNTTGYVFDAGAMPSADDAARIADAFGVEGDPVLTDDGYSVWYRVGPDDGSGPSVTLWDDAMLGWNYSGPWNDTVSYGCAVAGSPGIDPETVDAVEVDAAESSSGEAEPAEVEPAEPIELEPVGTVVCEEPDPPSGVPSADEAEALARGRLEALGVDTSVLEFEVWADEWHAGVSASEQIEGVTARTWSFGFGGDAVLEYAHGSTATPQPVGPYDLIDLDTAIERLNDGSYGYGGYFGGGGIAVMENDIAMGEPAIAIAEAPPEGGDVEMPGEVIPEPEEITVTLTDVDADIWWVWDVDGSAWLLPAYSFTGDDGGTYVVPAVTDEFLVEVEQPVDPPMPEPAPMPVEPEGPGDGAEPLPAPDMYLPGFDDPALTDRLGTNLDEFTAFVEDFGWGPVRVAWADGEGYDLTADLVVGRVNVAVETDGDGTQYVVGARVELDVSDPEVPEPVEAEAAVIEVYEGVGFYPACGDEVLNHESGTWYQVHASEYPDLYAKAVDGYREQPPETAKVSGFARVAPAGPGDDTGTLVVWSDGVARFVSDSGNLSTWLVDVELEYPWVC